MKRGDLFWTELPAGLGHLQSGRRPVVIVQDGTFGGLLDTVIVVPLTSRLAATRFPGTVRLEPDAHNGLRVTSVALLHQLTTVDLSWLGERLGSLSGSDLTAIFAALDRLTGRAGSAEP